MLPVVHSLCDLLLGEWNILLIFFKGSEFPDFFFPGNLNSWTVDVVDQTVEANVEVTITALIALVHCLVLDYTLDGGQAFWVLIWSFCAKLDLVDVLL